MRPFLTIFSLLLCCSLPAPAQTNDVLIIQGSVLEKNTQEPLPYATVSLKNNRMGTVSNSRGEFKFIISPTYRNDSLRISFIGFKSLMFKISEIPDNFKVFLEEDSQVLNEVVVTGLSARQLIEKAIEKVPDNYYKAPYISRGFYRLVSKKENSHVALSEAVFDVYHTRPAKKNQFRLDKMRAIKDEKTLKAIFVGLKANAAYEFDIINMLDEQDFLNKRAFKYHNFYLEGVTSYDDREVYVITFDQKNGLKKAAYKGEVLIDRETLAFVYFDYGLSPKGIKYHKSNNVAERALMALMGIHLNEVKARQQISYKNIDGRYYLSKAAIDQTFAIKSTSQHYNFNLDSRVDYLVTAIETDTCKPFESEEVLASGKWIEKQNSIYDQSFWDDYNIILPGADFSVMAEKIEASNKASDFKIEIENKLRKYPKDKGARIDSILSFYNNKDLFNGNALIEYKGEVIFEKSYNNALTNNHQQTQFRIGSTTKTFTAMLIMLLEQEGKLKLSDTVGMYLPDYLHPRLTIAQLLSHQSGIPNYHGNSEYLMKTMNNPYSLDELISNFCSDSLEF